MLHCVAIEFLRDTNNTEKCTNATGGSFYAKKSLGH